MNESRAGMSAILKFLIETCNAPIRMLGSCGGEGSGAGGIFR